MVIHTEQIIKGIRVLCGDTFNIKTTYLEIYFDSVYEEEDDYDEE